MAISPLNPLFIPAFSIEDVLLDKDTGAPLAGGQVFFFRDSQRGIKKPVYQITGNSPTYTFAELPNPMTLSSIGTFEDSLGNPVVPYFYPYDANGDPDYYYIVVVSAGGVPQFDREAVPYLGDISETEVLSVISNELSNPQFVQVNFDTTMTNYTYNVNTVTGQVINIAPDWDLVVSASGSGMVTVKQLAPAGTLNIPTNPATLLQISSSGLSQLLLRQRIFGSPNLWGNAFIAGTFVAKTYSGSPAVLTMYYSQSNGLVTAQQISTATLTGIYQAFPGSSTLIPASNSSDTFPNAYIDIYFVLPLSIMIDITSVMVASTGLTSIPGIIYDQESEARQIDHLFHYYQPQLNFKPIPSLLVGWDFPLNPAQLGTSFTATTTPSYTWDQTIIGSAVGNLTVAKFASTGGISITTVSGSEAFFLLQYLSGPQALKTTLSNLAVNIDAYATVNPGVKVNVYLYYSSNSGTIPTGTASAPGIIGAISYSSGTAVFTLTGSPATTWTLIPQKLGEPSSASLPNNVHQDLGFEGFNGTANYQSTSTTSFFAIVIAFAVPTAGTVVNINSISCVPGDIPTRPAPQTRDEVLRECQHYWEKSYALGDLPGTNTDVNKKFSIMNSWTTTANSNVYALPTAFEIDYQWKRAVPTIVTYTPSGTINNVLTQLNYLNSGSAFATVTANNPTNVSSPWVNPPDIGSNKTTFFPNSAAQLVTAANASASNVFTSASIAYHFVADARLGVV